MAITLKGIRLESVDLKRSDKSNSMELNSASYALISSADKVLANQSTGGYNSIAIAPSKETLELLEKFTSSYKRDITSSLGLEEA